MRSRTADVEPTRIRSAASTPHFPLRRLALCLDCDACFEIGSPTCPACGAESWVLLSRFLDHAPFRLLPQLHSLTGDWSGRPKLDTRERAQQVLVIARDQRALYEYARRAFAGNPTVQVVLDRRRAERRRGDQSRIPERRRGDRRALADVDDQLHVLGWAILRSEAFRARRAAAQ
jgi:hypothetical protein